MMDDVSDDVTTMTRLTRDRQQVSLSGDISSLQMDQRGCVQERSVVWNVPLSYGLCKYIKL